MLPILSKIYTSIFVRALHDFASNAYEMRTKLIDYGYFGFILLKRIIWPEDDPDSPESFGTPESWRDAMSVEGAMGDHVMLQVTANVLNRYIVLIPIFK